ncbi:MAG: BatD family protein [Chthoniobacterales bacterium]
MASSRTPLLLIVAFSVVALNLARADEPSVTAVLDNSQTNVGRPVHLQIKVSGARNAQMPREIPLDGLDIRYSGESQLFESQNFNFSYSAVYSYTIMPQRPGKFVIPPQTIRAGGKELRTPSLTLEVADGAPGTTRPGRVRGGVDARQAGFVELVVAKTSAYVGEVVPAQVRIGFNTTARVQAPSLGPSIEIPGQGFVAQKMPKPAETTQTIRGAPYQVITYKTAISAARAGKIEIGPVQVPAVVWVTSNNRQSMPRDPFGIDPFIDQFFNDPAFQPAMPQKVTLSSETATLDVKPLPPNAPPTFSGAIGTFTMTVEAKPTTAKIGDPITLTAKISGRGNFDRMNAPTVEDETGWHKYPSSGDFKQDDDVGISGVKTFDTVLSANERRDKLPPLVFSFFDPTKEQYITLRSDGIPVRIEGGAAASAPASSAAATAPTTGSTAATPPPSSQDLLYQLSDLPSKNESFTPLFARREFWLTQLVPLLAVIGFCLWAVKRTRANDRQRRRLLELQHEAHELQRRLRRADLPPRDYIGDATRAVQLKVALAENVSPQGVDAETAARAFGVDDATRDQLRQLFAESDELRYSGGNGNAALSPQRQREVAELVEALR